MTVSHGAEIGFSPFFRAWADRIVIRVTTPWYAGDGSGQFAASRARRKP